MVKQQAALTAYCLEQRYMFVGKCTAYAPGQPANATGHTRQTGTVDATRLWLAAAVHAFVGMGQAGTSPRATHQQAFHGQMARRYEENLKSGRYVVHAHCTLVFPVQLTRGMSQAQHSCKAKASGTHGDLNHQQHLYRRDLFQTEQVKWTRPSTAAAHMVEATMNLNSSA